MRHLLLWTAAFTLLAACGGASRPANGGNSRLGIAATFYPLAFLAQEVGKDLVQVQNLTPPGAEPHDLELTSGKVRALSDADLVVYLGGGFQPAVQDAVESFPHGKAWDILATQKDLKGAPSGEEGRHTGNREPSGGGQDAGERGPDPHVWLDPRRMAGIGNALQMRLARLDPENAGAYRANAAHLETELDSLDRSFRMGLANCKRRVIVTSHEAFGYLASSYGLEEVGVSGLDPESEPSPGRLAELVRFVKDNSVQTIFFEVLVSPEVAETLARETGAVTAKLDPLEGPPERGDYLDAMRANLDALRAGLGCR